MKEKLLIIAAILSLAAPALRAEEGEEEPAEEASPAAPEGGGQSRGEAGLREQKPDGAGRRDRREDREAADGGSGGAVAPGDARKFDPRRMRVYATLDYPSLKGIPRKGAHPHFVFKRVGDGVSIGFIAIGGGSASWALSPGIEGSRCMAEIWVSDSPGGAASSPNCDPPQRSLYANLPMSFAPKAPRGHCVLTPGKVYFVNVAATRVDLVGGEARCSVYLDQNGYAKGYLK